MDKLKYEECENCKDWNGCMADCMDTCVKPLDALKEFNQYRSIGTVEECRVAVEKTKMKPPLHWTDDCNDYFFCPNCQQDYKYNCSMDDGLKYRQHHCEKCGQAIDWRKL